jgi:hypothetical protein
MQGQEQKFQDYVRACNQEGNKPLMLVLKSHLHITESLSALTEN